MANIPDMFLSSWGDIELFVSSLEWESGNTIVQHDLAAGDFHPVQPRGARLGKATAQLMFDDFDGARESPRAAFRRFRATFKERRLFTHPVDGSFFAVIGELKVSMDESSVIKATCEFIPDNVVIPVSPAGSGTTASSGESSVVAAADLLADRLATAGIGMPARQMRRLDFTKPIRISVEQAFIVDPRAVLPPVSITATASADVVATTKGLARANAFAFANVYQGGFSAALASAVAQTSGLSGPASFAFALASAALDQDARASVSSWSDEGISARQIGIDASRLSQSIATMIEIGNFEGDLQLYPSFQSAILLGDAIRSAVVAATSETPSVFVVRVGTRTSLLAICARTYGGADAQERARQVASLNDVRTQGWLDPGDYLMPTRPTSSSSALLEDLEA